MKKLTVFLTLIFALVVFSGAASAAYYNDFSDPATLSEMWLYQDPQDNSDGYLHTGTHSIADGMYRLASDLPISWMYVGSYPGAAVGPGGYPDDPDFMGFDVNDVVMQYDVMIEHSTEFFGMNSTDGFGISLEGDLAEGVFYDFYVDINSSPGQSYDEIQFVQSDWGTADDDYVRVQDPAGVFSDTWYTMKVVKTATDMICTITDKATDTVVFSKNFANGSTINQINGTERIIDYSVLTSNPVAMSMYAQGGAGYFDYVFVGSQAEYDAQFGGEVPVPGAIWLFGSGLLGMVGLRRRNRK